MDSLVPGQQEQRSDHKHAQADYDWSGPGLRRQCQHESGTDMLERQEVRPIETLRGAGTPCRHIVRKCHWLVELIPQPVAAGNLYLADAGAGLVFRVAGDGRVSVFAGGGTRSGPESDGGPATAAQLWSPRGMVFDSKGNLDIAEPVCGCIRQVSPAGIIDRKST